MRKPFSSEASATPSSKPASTPANPRVHTASILLLALALVFPVQSFGEDSAALTAQTQAYITLVHADEARELEKWKEAGIHYRKALKEYKHIQSAHPEFNDDIISYRVAYCQNQLNSMAKKLTATLQPKASADLFESKYNAARQENAYLRSRLEELEDQLDQAGDSTDLKKDIERLQLELAQMKSGQNNAETSLLQDVQRAREEADHFRGEVDRQKTVLAELKVIAAEHEQATDRMNEQASEIASLKASTLRLTDRLKKAEQAVTDKQQAKTSNSARQEAAFKEMQSQLKNEQNINRQLITQVAAADQRVRELKDANEKQSKEVTQFGQQVATLLGREQDAAIAMAEQKKEIEALLKAQAAQTVTKASVVPLKKFQDMEADMAALSERWKESTQKLQALEKDSNTLTQRNAALEKDLQAAKAKEADPATTQTLNNEIQALKKESQDMAQRNAALEKDLQAAKSKEADPATTQTLNNEIKALKNESQALAQRNAALEKDLQAAKSKEADPAVAKALESQVKALEEESKNLGQRNEALEKDLEAATAREADPAVAKFLKNQIKALEDQSNALAKRNGDLEKDLQKAKANEADPAVAKALKNEIKALEDERNALTKRYADLEKDLQKAKENETDPAVAKDLKNEIKALEDERNALTKRYAELEKDLNTSKAKETDPAVAKALKNQIKALEDEREAQSQRTAALEKELQKAKANEADLAATQARENQIKALEDERNALTKRYTDLEKDLNAAKAKETDPAVAKALKNEIKMLADESKELAKRNADLEKDLEAAKAKEADPEVARARDAAVKKTESLEKALKDAANDLKKAEVQVQELKTAAKGANKSKKLDQENKSLLAEINELRNTGKAQLDEAGKRAAEKDNEIKKLSVELKALRDAQAANQAAAAKNTAELNKEHQALASRNAQVQSEVESLTKAKDEFSAKAGELERQLGNSLREQGKSKETTAKLENELASLLSNLKPLQEENKKLKGDLKDSLKALDGVQAAMEKTISNRIRPVQDEADRLMEDVAELKSYRESVGAVTSKELARLREELAKLKGLPPPSEAHLKNPAEQKPPLDTMLREGQAREREGNLEEASALYNRILEVAPGQGGAAKGLSRIYLQTSQPEKVQPLLTGVLKENKYDAEALLLLGLAQYTTDDYREATSTLKKLVKKHDEHSQGWNALGASLMAQEKFRDARESFERAIALEAKLGDAHYNLAQVLRIDSPKEKDLIRQHYQTAMTLGSSADADMDTFLKAQ